MSEQRRDHGIDHGEREISRGSAPEPLARRVAHRFRTHIWKGVLGLGALAGAIVAVAGVVRLVWPERPAKPAVPLVERIDTAAARYGNALDDAARERDPVDPAAARRWRVDAAGIKSAIHADFSEAIEVSWDRYDATLRSAERLLDAASDVNAEGLELAAEPDAPDLRRGLFATRLLVARAAADDLIAKAGGGDLEGLVHAETADFDDAWAEVMARADRRRSQVDDGLLGER